jgi:hypothetical protein
MADTNQSGGEQGGTQNDPPPPLPPPPPPPDWTVNIDIREGDRDIRADKEGR